jgi:hypothetical protein
MKDDTRLLQAFEAMAEANEKASDATWEAVRALISYLGAGRAEGHFLLLEVAPGSPPLPARAVELLAAAATFANGVNLVLPELGPAARLIAARDGAEAMERFSEAVAKGRKEAAMRCTCPGCMDVRRAAAAPSGVS